MGPVLKALMVLSRGCQRVCRNQVVSAIAPYVCSSLDLQRLLQRLGLLFPDVGLLPLEGDPIVQPVYNPRFI